MVMFATILIMSLLAVAVCAAAFGAATRGEAPRPEHPARAEARPRAAALLRQPGGEAGRGARRSPSRCC